MFRRRRRHLKSVGSCEQQIELFDEEAMGEEESRGMKWILVMKRTPMKKVPWVNMLFPLGPEVGLLQHLHLQGESLEYDANDRTGIENEEAGDEANDCYPQDEHNDMLSSGDDSLDEEPFAAYDQAERGEGNSVFDTDFQDLVGAKFKDV